MRKILLSIVLLVGLLLSSVAVSDAAVPVKNAHKRSPDCPKIEVEQYIVCDLARNASEITYIYHWVPAEALGVPVGTWLFYYGTKQVDVYIAI